MNPVFFQNGGSYLCAVDDSNDHVLSVWDWQREERLADVKVSARACCWLLCDFPPAACPPTASQPLFFSLGSWAPHSQCSPQIPAPSPGSHGPCPPPRRPFPSPGRVAASFTVSVRVSPTLFYSHGPLNSFRPSFAHVFMLSFDTCLVSPVHSRVRKHWGCGDTEMCLLPRQGGAGRGAGHGLRERLAQPARARPQLHALGRHERVPLPDPGLSRGTPCSGALGASLHPT